jgi:ankyrin repeat protein
VNAIDDVRLPHSLCQNVTDARSASQDTRAPLHWAASVGALDVTRFLLDHGANADAGDGSGWTALHIAGAWGLP